jgi:hypothetical protein
MPGFVPNWAANIVTLNVKDFGAVGDGSHDDAPKIQACFDAAFGSYLTDHTNPFGVNAAVFFPSGNYRTTAPLYISQAAGGRVYGAGLGATQILFEGDPNQGNVIFSSPNDTWTPILALNRVQNFEFSGMTLSCNLAAAGQLPLSVNMLGIYMDQQPSGLGNIPICSLNSFKNMEFQNVHIGVFGGLFGLNCENMQFYECNFRQCRSAGIRTASQNTVNWAVYGGAFLNCASFGGSGIAGERQPTGSITCVGGGVDLIANPAFENGIHSSINYPSFGGVSAGASNGAGGNLIRLGLNDALTGSWGTNYFVRVGRVTGTGAGDVNGVWKINTVDSNHIDLQGTTYNAAHAYAGGDVFAAYAFDVYAASAPIAIVGGSSESQLGIYAGVAVSIDGFVFRPDFPDTVWIYGNSGHVTASGCQYGATIGGSPTPPPVIMDCQNNSIGVFNGLSGGGNGDSAVFKSFGPAGEIIYNGQYKFVANNLDAQFAGFLGDVILNVAPMAIASLPTPRSCFKNTRLTVTDCTSAYSSATIGNNVASLGGGANVVPVRCLNGTTWTIG